MKFLMEMIKKNFLILQKMVFIECYQTNQIKKIIIIIVKILLLLKLIKKVLVIKQAKEIYQFQLIKIN